MFVTVWRSLLSLCGEPSLTRNQVCHLPVRVCNVVKVEVTLWLTVSQYVLVSRTLVRLATTYYFLSVCCCLKFSVLFFVGRPLWWEDGSAICNAITQWSMPRRTHNHTLLSHLRPSQPGGPGSHIYIPQEQSGPVIQALGSLYVASCDSQGYSGGILTLPQPGESGQDGPVKSQKSKPRYDRRSVNQYVLVPSPCGFRGAPSQQV
jgi:hypothetical protein